MPEGYCFTCRAKREIKNPQKVTLKNGQAALRGVCPRCGSGLVLLVASINPTTSK